MVEPVVTRWLPLLVAVSLGCGRSKADSSVNPDDSAGPEEDRVSHQFVSTNKNEQEYRAPEEEEGFSADYGDGYQITTVSAARELAEAAAEPHLNPRQTWKTSPALPAAWPAHGHTLAFYFFAMADSPHSMSHYQLFSAGWRATVSLVDGTTEIKELKTRKLGTVVEKRPSVLERNELELAERSLIHMMLGGDADAGEDNFWGYLKYFHEHPKFAGDIQKKAPRFHRWITTRKGRRYRR